MRSQSLRRIWLNIKNISFENFKREFLETRIRDLSGSFTRNFSVVKRSREYFALNLVYNYCVGLTIFVNKRVLINLNTSQVESETTVYADRLQTQELLTKKMQKAAIF
jgi:hypothetical protein